MTAQDFVPYFLAINTLMSVASIAYAVLSSSGKEALSGLKKLEADIESTLEKLGAETHLMTGGLSGRCQMLEQSVAVLQSTVEHLPSSAATHKLELGMTRLEGRVETLTERLQPIAAMATRLQDIAMKEPVR